MNSNFVITVTIDEINFLYAFIRDKEGIFFLFAYQRYVQYFCAVMVSRRFITQLNKMRNTCLFFICVYTIFVFWIFVFNH